MNTKYRIRNHSTYDNYTFQSCGDNVSDVIDAVLRKTVKITEHYASDILYHLDSFRDAVKKKESWKGLLLFRESGVSLKGITDGEVGETVEVFDISMYLQFWHLEYTQKDGAVFKRVDLVSTR